MFKKFIRWISASEATTTLTQQIIGFLGWLGVFSTGIFASWTAAMTQWVADYGPIVWVIVGIFVAFVAAIILRVTSGAILRLAQARLTRSYAFREGRINPLKNSFDNEVVNISDFYSPGPMLYSNKVFRNCEIRGPSVIVCTATGRGRIRMDKVEGTLSVLETTNPTFDSNSIVNFQDVTFLDCKFYGVTIIGPPGLHKLLLGSDPARPHQGVSNDGSPEEPL